MGLEMKLERRRLLLHALRFSFLSFIGLLPFQLGCSRSETACYDPELFSTPERSLRESRGYVDASPHADARQCGGCEFFRAGEPEGCGRCEILGGAVAARGYCDSWAAREST
jgi:hypothetical protein